VRLPGKAREFIVSALMSKWLLTILISIAVLAAARLGALAQQHLRVSDLPA
jgi:hypothetical protein